MPSPATEEEPHTGGISADEDQARAKKEKIGRYVAMFGFPFLMVTMMIGGYLGAMHAPTPHEMPVAVAGQSDDAQKFSSSLESAEGSAVDVRTVSTSDEARALVLSRKAVAAISLSDDSTSAVLYTAGAAGASQAGTAIGLLAPQIAAQDLHLTTEDLAPLPQHDSAGLAAMFMTVGLMLAGYMPLSLVLSTSPELLRLRRAVPLLAGWAALTSTLIWLIVGPTLGAVEGHAATIIGIGWLSVFAVGSVQLFLTRILGPLAVLVGMLFLMVLGTPASNLGMSVYTMPSFFTALHRFLPSPATGEALRSILYFKGDGVGGYVSVLIIGALLALGATLGIDALKRRHNPNAALPQPTMQSLTGGKRPSAPVRYLTVALFPLTMMGMMVTLMLSSMYQPTPRDMPVAIVASTTGQAEQAADGLDKNMQGLFDLQTTDSVDDARALVDNRDVVAAYILPSEADPRATLIVNQAAGMSQQQVVQAVFGQVTDSQNVSLIVDNRASLNAQDSAGTVSMYLAMGWIMAGFMIIVVGANALPEVMRPRTLLPIVVGWSVVMSVVLWLIAGPIVGALHGHFWPLVGVGTIAIFSVAMFTTIFVRLMGLLAVLPVMAVLMFLGMPASGGGLSIYMEPSIYRVLHDFLPMPAAVESIRSIIYFGGDTVSTHLLTLALWGAVSMAVIFVVNRVKPVPEPVKSTAT